VFLDVVAHRPELEGHRNGRARVVRVDHEDGRPEVGARLLAEPADDGHAAVITLVVDELFAPQVVVEVDLVPGLAECADAVGHGLDADRLGIVALEPESPSRVVVQEEDAAMDGQEALASMDQRPVEMASGDTPTRTGGTIY